MFVGARSRLHRLEDLRPDREQRVSHFRARHVGDLTHSGRSRADALRRLRTRSGLPRGQFTERGGVLSQSAVADLHMAQLSREDMKRGA